MGGGTPSSIWIWDCSPTFKDAVSTLQIVPCLYMSLKRQLLTSRYIRLQKLWGTLITNYLRDIFQYGANVFQSQFFKINTYRVVDTENRHNYTYGVIDITYINVF